MKVLLLCLAMSLAFNCLAHDANDVHGTDKCGELGPGTGLKDGKGWVASMVPGTVQFRVRGKGSVSVTVAHLDRADFLGGKVVPIYTNLQPGDVLEWKFINKDWAPIDQAFLYP